MCVMVTIRKSMFKRIGKEFQVMNETNLYYVLQII